MQNKSESLLDQSVPRWWWPEALTFEMVQTYAQLNLHQKDEAIDGQKNPRIGVEREWDTDLFLLHMWNVLET